VQAATTPLPDSTWKAMIESGLIDDLPLGITSSL